MSTRRRQGFVCSNVECRAPFSAITMKSASTMLCPECRYEAEREKRLAAKRLKRRSATSTRSTSETCGT